jgi:type IV secretory pathway ATPase VirB11/archaellum biosynthesis ATPase
MEMSIVRQLFGKKDVEEREVRPQVPAQIEPPEEISGVLDTYRVPPGGKPDASAEVFIVDDEGNGKYLVRLPKLGDVEKEALEVLRVNLLDSIPLDAKGDPREVVANYIWQTAEAAGLAAVVQESHDKLLYYLVRDFAGFWEVDPLVNDDKLEEISVSRYDRPVRVLHRNFSEYMWMETDITYPTEERLQAFIRRLAQLGSTTVSLAQPSLEVTLHGQSDRRVTATLGDEISRPGSTYAIRKQRESPITLAQLAAPEHSRWPALGVRGATDPGWSYDEVHSHKTLSVLMAAYFWLLLERTTNVLIAGESVDHDEPILVKEDGRIKLTRIGELVDREFNAGEQGRVPIQGVEVVCFDPRTLETSWSPLQYVYRHKHTDPLLRFRLKTGREVAVTPDHSIFVLRSGWLRCIKADEVTKGDFVATPRRIQGNEDSRAVVNVLDELADHDGIYLYGVPHQVFDRSSGEQRPGSWKDWKHHHRLPIRYAHLLNEGERRTVKLGYKGSPIRMETTIEFDEEIGRLLGYYAAEGWSHLDPGREYTTALSFGEKDNRLIPDSVAILKRKFGIHARVKAAGKSRVVIFNHRILGELLTKWIGTDASNKRVPDAIFSSPSYVRKAFISGWAAGDYDGSVSRDLCNGISYLLLMENCVSTTTSRWTKPNSRIDGRVIRPLHPLLEIKFPVHQELVSGEYRVSRRWGEPLVPTSELPNPLGKLQASNYPKYKTLSPTLLCHLRSNLDSIATKGANDGRYSRLYVRNEAVLREEIDRMSKLQENFAFLEVVSIDGVEPASKFVYDVSVPGCENFLAGLGGVFCHNTNSGKTTLMNAILALAHPKYKIVTAEDVLEINLPDQLHWQRLKTRSYRAGLSPISGRYEYGLPELLKLALRFSPTILSLGEMRGEESETVAAAITLGFSTMTTIHAESAERCVQRLTTPPMRFSEGHVRDITAIATMRKVVLQDGRVVRRVVSVDELKPSGAYEHEIVNVFRYSPATDSFFPTTPAEVLDRSFRLNEIADSFGWSPAAVQSSLAVRAARISERIAGGGLDHVALSKMVREFATEESKHGAGRNWGRE